jgi:hypothetical protein
MLELLSELIKEYVNYFGEDKDNPSMQAINGQRKPDKLCLISRITRILSARFMNPEVKMLCIICGE